MFTQKISMDCTKEQYERYLKYELFKMGYNLGWFDAECLNVVVNNYAGTLGEVNSTDRPKKTIEGRTYLGSFNPELFLALAAMTDINYKLSYGEWAIQEDDVEKWFRYTGQKGAFMGVRKATKEEIMEKFGEKKSNHNTHKNTNEVADKPCNDINEFDGERIREYIDYFFSRSIDESDAINVLKSKGYKILKPKTWEEV